MSDKKPVICGIAAVGPYNIIGQGTGMPWHSKRDFYHFRNTTTPFPVIFGKNTYDGMPKKPLPNRFNLVCSSHYQDEYVDGVFYARSLESALAQCKDFERVFICGGNRVYQYALDNDLIDVMYITNIHNQNLASQIKSAPDTFVRFPVDVRNFFKSPNWIREKISYPNGVLPDEIALIKTKFYKYSRVR